MKIINEFEDKIFERKIVTYTVEKKGATPSRMEFQKEIAKLNKTKPELVIIEKVASPYGAGSFIIEAVIYTNEKARKLATPKYLVKKSEIKTENPVEEAKEEV